MFNLLKIAGALFLAASLGACAVVPPQVAYTGPSVGIVVGPAPYYAAPTPYYAPAPYYAPPARDYWRRPGYGYRRW